MLGPKRGVIAVSKKKLIDFDANQIATGTVGQKAAGLLTLPGDWTIPFFVVLDEALYEGINETQLLELLREAAVRAGVDSNRVMVRSNGVEEGLTQRGALLSSSCLLKNAAKTLLALHSNQLAAVQSRTHWLVQGEVTVHSRGLLSNERRVRYEKRDWAIETEVPNGSGVEQASLGVRRWRDGRAIAETTLLCDSSLEISLALRRVARWAVQDPRRFLFEWVWNGTAIYVVQMDAEISKGGKDPRELLPDTVSSPTRMSLRLFKEATVVDKSLLKKLGNAGLYESLGYAMPPFYLLKITPEIISSTKPVELSVDLIGDLRKLTELPLVLRTDGFNIPKDMQEMLPRSEELRTAEAALTWLVEKFNPAIQKLALENCAPVLIAHHFIPSVASAWAGAEPGRRWVRIEALWGIPESLYWHSHDTFEVDTENANLSKSFINGSDYPFRSRSRFKGTFIAPDSQGSWVHHQTKEPFDWNNTIDRPEWLFEIAHTTRRICERLGRPVEVMWFVGTHQAATKHPVLPWYHSVPGNIDVPVRAPRKKIKTAQELVLHNQQDWAALQQRLRDGIRIERVTVEPRDPDLDRNLDFATGLGKLAKLHGFVIVLAGGILSHAYHALRRTGASVECVDLFGADEEKAEYNKLIRDKVPGQIADRGERFEVVRLVGAARITALRRKLVEEALEALDANAGTELIGELADVQEVVRAIIREIQISPRELEHERVRKLQKRGGFDEGHLLLTTASPRSILQKSADLLPSIEAPDVRTISDPLSLPQRPVYKRPDFRILPDSTEELLVVETELSRLGSLEESVDFEVPPSRDAQRYNSSIVVRRSGSELRLELRVRSQSGGQLKLDFLAN